MGNHVKWEDLQGDAQAAGGNSPVVARGTSRMSREAHVRMRVQTNADAFSGSQSHRGKSQNLRSLSGREEGNRDF